MKDAALGVLKVVGLFAAFVLGTYVLIRLDDKPTTKNPIETYVGLHPNATIWCSYAGTSQKYHVKGGIEWSDTLVRFTDDKGQMVTFLRDKNTSCIIER